MRFSNQWLIEYLDSEPSAEEVAENLTAVGLAVESVEHVGGDARLEVEITSNRPDCMSHVGLAREVAAATGAGLTPPEIAHQPQVETARTDSASVEIEDTQGCPRYVAVVVRGVRVGASPQWLVERLESVGARPINNVVDVTNFVLWETGQPLHGFDLATLPEGRIVVRRARAGESLVTLDGETRELTPETLVIADVDKPIALAGVMGGAETEVSEATTDVLIESAHFAPPLVRKTARRLGLHTDASHRFERGADPERCLEAALRAAELIVQLGGGEIEAAVVDARGTALPELSGSFELERLNRFGGVEIPAEFVVETLDALGFRLQEEGPDRWRAFVPSWRRFDFELDPEGTVYPAYFYEEVLRVWGFESIEATLPSIEHPDEGSGRGHRHRERLRAILTAGGLAETVTYAFHAPEDDARFAGLRRAGEPARLANPLSEQYSVMRRSLLPNLVAGAVFNLHRGAEAVRLFEIGGLFPGGDSEQVETLAVVLGGSLGGSWEGAKELDFFDLKGLVDALAAGAGIELSYATAELPDMVSGASAEIRVSGSDALVGYLGRIDDPELGVPVFGLEIETGVFDTGRVPAVEAPSRFPGIRMDTTFTHDLEVSWAEIAGAVREAAPAELCDFGLKVRYLGEGVPEGAVNTTISFLYGADDRSLTHDEINRQHEGLAALLVERFGRKESHK